MSESIQLTFTYHRAEYLRAIRRYYKDRMRIPVDLILAMCLIGLGIFIIYSGEYSFLGILSIIVGIILLLLVGYALFVLPILIYASQPKLKQKYDLSFTDAGIGFRTEAINSKLEWSLYNKWIVDNEFYILYHGKRELSVIPRRAFQNSSQDENFREMLTTHIGPPKDGHHR
jgi:hypothetical protein